MTGTVPVKPPLTGADWARGVEQKLAEPENQVACRVGGWTLFEQQETGNLGASHTSGGTVILAEPPEDAEKDPDKVETNDQPAIKVERVNNQQGPRGSVQLVVWDTMSFQAGGWGFASPGTDLVIPRDGLYLICYDLYFLNTSTVVNKALLFVGGVVKMAAESNGNGGAFYPSFHFSQTFPLTADTIVSAGAYTAGSGTMDFGASGADPTVYTSMSITRQPVG